ncbi:M20/M25/M40 family metallo-hydrolase [Agrobacterium vitis]|uniref:M20/M25/M40 family metallo-hydrolase n=1 Tax=Agrobacterium vitis TaxID=373 RepID=A0A368P189_AGRVI|nr:M20/M25/M40 family metallo-hydrolase [Agrobacterium vitis]KAA3518365.1 M20/M25/M40 family metallo-hydrolase [Agrobacterium vitis]KAA3529962.1 M20/M25/M40 family metallo-hydrolase [Agrobacterium vitis]MCF1476694.1 M20/M25/M40 family metallo-hydrolase [Agrobacterium vitis]MUZ99182.1 M20/M25/M40 family metallo-hydrolase [Agrobacterium vitis]MVA29220.1 M20/M25/M40 family metallo-hydrolase [Agrobacterium vitis]
MTDLETVLARVDDNLPSSLETLFDLVRIPSISTDPAYSPHCRKAAQFLAAYLTGIGFAASVRDTSGHPMVVAHHEGQDADCPHVLFYGHYDVQPVDPLNLWQNDPFDPAIRDSATGEKIITGRGTSDDKGQLLTFIEALRAFKDTKGGLPVRVTILFEGEEESGSPSLQPFLEANAQELKADFAMVCDTGMWDAHTPAICASLRGLVGEEITIKAASRDLHSGGYGGVAANPLHVLSDILAGLHDATGAVTLPGFYNGVDETPPDIKAVWADLEKTQTAFLTDIGLSVPSGEKGRSVLELLWARPTAEINGMSGGYTGKGFKTVIAAEAMAKVSFRLVGKQDPKKIRDSFRAYVTSKLPRDCRVEFHAEGASPAIQLPYDSPILATAKAALSQEWQKPAIVVGGGGSIPIVGSFQSMLGMDSLLVGFSLDDDCVHSPNEKYNLTSFHKGTRSWVRILHGLSDEAINRL